MVNNRINLTIPGKPMGKQRPKFWNGHAATPTKTVNYETLVKELYIANKLPMLEGAIMANISIYYDIPKSTSKKKKALMLDWEIYPTKKPDIDNILKIIFDALNGIAYKDDSQIINVSCEKKYDENARVIVNLYEVH